MGSGVGNDISCTDFGEYYALNATATAHFHVAGDKESYEAGFAVIKAANNIFAWGGKPVSVSVAITLPERYTENKLKQITADLDRACASIGASLTGGHTACTDKVSEAVVSVTVLGICDKTTFDSLGRANAGMDIVVSKWEGIEEMLILLNDKKEELLKRLPLGYVEGACKYSVDLSVASEAAVAIKHGVAAMHDVSEGGIFAALWDIAEKNNLGINVDLCKIPMLQETIEFCEVFDINPYVLPSAGSLIMITADGEALVQALEAENISASVIGRFTDNNDKIITNGEEIRFLDKP